MALSGGKDSVSLFDLLTRAGLVQQSLTVDHGLQKASARWAQFCEQLSVARGVPHLSQRVEVFTNRQARKLGLEQAARQARYAALADMAANTGCQIIALAQHADDQAETVLLQALRGAGLAGLSGMPVLRELKPGLWLWRPLLTCTRAQIEAYVRRRGLAFVNDPSNRDTRFTRNALRRQVMPAVAGLAPAYALTLARVASHATQANAILQEVAQQDMQQLSAGREGIDLRGLLVLTPGRQAGVLRAQVLAAGLRAMSEPRLADLMHKLRASALQPKALGTVLLMHEQHAWSVRRGRVLLQPQALPGPQLRTLPAVIEPVDLPALLNSGQFQSKCFYGTLHLKRSSSAKFEELAAANARVELRSRAAAGARLHLRLHPQGRARTLKNLYQEAGIPVAARAAPMLFVDDELVFVPGVGVAAEWQPAELAWR